jgi:glycosyltransferase involved in cell wall biosynthesis
VPCFNEERRLQPEGLLRLLAAPAVRVLLVDDGSSDGTLLRLHEVKARAPDRVDVLSLARNTGKAEAVRQGLRAALAQGSSVVAYLDADLATPPQEMLRLLTRLEAGKAEVVLGARVALLGRDIQRNPLRHYLGRVFASFSAVSLGMRVYDTQCGAKAFRATEALRRALEAPFGSRWIFDVELISRLLSEGLEPAHFVEVPLREWRDVKGSTLSVGSMALALGEITALGVRRRLIYSGLRRK